MWGDPMSQMQTCTPTVSHCANFILVEMYAPIDVALANGYEAGLNGHAVRFWIGRHPRRSDAAGKIHIEAFGAVGMPGNSDALSSSTWSDDYDFENRDFSPVVRRAMGVICERAESDVRLSELWAEFRRRKVIGGVA